MMAFSDTPLLLASPTSTQVRHAYLTFTRSCRTLNTEPHERSVAHGDLRVFRQLPSNYIDSNTDPVI